MLSFSNEAVGYLVGSVKDSGCRPVMPSMTCTGTNLTRTTEYILCEVFMENDKQWITYVIITDSEAGWLEIRTAPRQRNSGYRSSKKA